jgi:2-oxoglutarate ferredoxin oxidoreductase subunit gamma
MNDSEIRVTGFGGQGVVLLAYVIGRAAAIEAGRHSTMIQTFGPEARGSTCSATLVVSDREVLYPYIRSTDVLVVMSNEAYDKYKDELKPGGILVYESSLVQPVPVAGQRAFGAPSTRIAESLKRPIVGNMVMLGFVTAATGITTREVMREAVKASVPSGTEAVNLQGFDAGWAHFEKEYGSGKAEPEAAAAGVAGGRSVEEA